MYSIRVNVLINQYNADLLIATTKDIEVKWRSQIFIMHSLPRVIKNTVINEAHSGGWEVLVLNKRFYVGTPPIAQTPFLSNTILGQTVYLQIPTVENVTLFINHYHQYTPGLHCIYLRLGWITCQTRGNICGREQTILTCIDVATITNFTIDVSVISFE